MTVVTCAVTANTDDWDWQGTGAYILQSRYLRDITPEKSDQSHGNCDCTSVPSNAIISLVEFGCAHNSYTASRGLAKEYTVQIRNTTGVQQATSTGHVFTAYVGAPVIHWDTMPSTFNAHVNKGGKTWMSIKMEDPGGGNARQMNTIAHELDGAYPDTAYRIRVTYTLPTSHAQAIVVGC